MSAALHWPWPAWEEEARLAQQRLWQALQGLPLTGVEASMRISAAGIEAGRWVAAFDPQGVAAQRLSSLVQGLGLSPLQAQEVLQRAPAAHRIGVGLEQRGLQCRRKLYLEHALPQPQTFLQPGQQPARSLMIEAYKQVEQPEAALSRTAYWRLSGWSTGQLLGLLQSHDEAGAGWLAQALGAALARQPRWQGARLLQVMDEAGPLEPNPRQGVGLRLYGSGLLMADLDPLWMTLAQVFDLGHVLERALAAVSEVEVGWLHAGHDAHGQPYFIVYGPLHERAWAALRQGLPTLSNLRSTTGIES